MTGEWIRFAAAAFLLVLGLLFFTAAVVGVWRFGFVMNRMHAAGIGDTMGILCTVLALCIASGIGFDTLKLLLLVFFMWFTSPVSTHFLGQVAFFTDGKIFSHLSWRKEGDADDIDDRS